MACAETESTQSEQMEESSATDNNHYNDMIAKLLMVKTPTDMVHTISEEDIEKLLHDVREVFMAESTLLDVVDVTFPIKVCGDIHGQYNDLLQLFRVCGPPPLQSYVFMGDYVDRGPQSLEVICLLFAYKMINPRQMNLLRGNHETTSVNRVYGFHEECRRRYSSALWACFQEVFDCMPLAGLVEGRVLCMHGGISPSLTSWQQIREIKRPLRIPNRGIATDLLWADPSSQHKGWARSRRGISFTFGADVVDDFCQRLDIDLICRAHQVVHQGFKLFGQQKNLVTVFSAPNYGGQFNNSAAVMSIDQDLHCTFEVIRPRHRQRQR